LAPSPWRWRAQPVARISSRCRRKWTKQQVAHISSDQSSLKAAVDNAAHTASSALSAAQQAQNRADAAASAAQAAQQSCDAVNDKIDRMFKKSGSGRGRIRERW
jgi:hypothetical protein